MPPKRSKWGDKQKVSESVWKSLFFSTSLALGLLLTWRREWRWLYDYDALFASVPQLYRTGAVDRDLYWFNMFQMGFYVHSVVAHVFIETRRSDFAQMLVHHVVTLVLIGASFSLRFVAAGAIIVLVHDASDVLFEIAKLHVYSGDEWRANVWFAAWVLSWIGLRLVYFPRYIVYGAVWESVAHLGAWPHHATCSALLCALQALHVFWSVLIGRMVWRLCTGQATSVKDTRENEKRQ